VYVGRKPVMWQELDFDFQCFILTGYRLAPFRPLRIV
jgi:hypothetical protein